MRKLMRYKMKIGEQLKKERRELETKIENLITEFSEVTGLAVRKLTLYSYSAGNGVSAHVTV